MRKVLFWIVGLGLLLIVSGYFGLSYVQSHFFRNEILPKVLTAVEESSGAKVQIEDVQVRLLRGVSLKNLKLEMNKPLQRVSLSIDEARIRYSLWSLLSRDFEVSEIAATQVKVSGEMTPPEDVPRDQPPLRELLLALLKPLETLPLKVSLEDIRVSPIDLEVRYLHASAPVDLRWKGMSVEASAEVERNRLQLALQVKLPQESSQVLQAQLPKTEIQMSPHFEWEMNLEATRENAWSLKISECQAEFGASLGVKKIPVAQISGDLNASDRLELDLNLDLDLKEEIRNQLKLPLKEDFRIKNSFTLRSTETANELLNKWLLGENPRALEFDLRSQIASLQVQTAKLGASELKSSGSVNLDPENLGLSTRFTFQSEGVNTGFEEKLPLPLFQKGLWAEGNFEYSLKSGLKLTAFQVENAVLNSESSTLKANLSGSIFPQTKSLNLQGGLELLSGRGIIRIPWNFQKTERNRLRFETEIFANDFSIKSPQMNLQGLFAKIPVRIDLVWKGGADFRLAEIITRNPFERVDYATIRPYVSGAEANFRFEKLQMGSYQAGPLFADLSIRQNLLMAEHYQVDLLDGRAAGLAFIDLHPDAPRFGFLGRVSGLNPRLLTETKGQESDRRLSSRMAVVYDLQKSSLEGRFDITEIGGPQLIALINVMDPKYQNGKFNLARSALKVSAPEYVGMRMNQGSLDLSMDLGGAIEVSNLSVDNIPLSPLLSMLRSSVSEQLAARKQ